MKKLGTYLFLLFSVVCNAHKGDSLKLSNAAKLFQLKSIASDAFHSRKEADRMAANKEFLKAVEAIASQPGALDFPFDSIKDISTLNPKDGKFKLITWNVHKDDQTHLYFGFLLVNNSKRVKKGFLKHETVTNYEYFKLLDNSGSIKNPETHIGTPDKWFGMIYYSLIECDGYYTLLGYDPNDKLISRKFIDALYFKSDGTPVFGKDIFKFPRKNPKRLMFEYSSDVTMSLKYNNKTNCIVYSHLGPREEGEVMQGLPQYYGPDGSFDSMYQRKGKWILTEAVDVRNEKSKKDKEYNDPKLNNSTKKTKLIPKQK
jgi:hypothetical protein